MFKTLYQTNNYS